MPNKIFLGPLRDMWKTVADWVSGTSNDEPKVDVSDRAARKLGEVTLTGTVMELYVTDWDDLPDPASVPLGATAQLIGTFDVRQSDGSDWVEVIL